MENLPFFDGIREDWKSIGKSEGQFEMLLDLVETKFGKVPDELRERLKSLKNYEQIKQAMRKAMSAETIEEYLAKLEH